MALAAVTGQGSSASASATCMGKTATIVGTAGADRLNGTAGRDVIAAGAGADRVDAGGGQDLVCGGPGGDRISGGSGADQLRGEGGNDRLDGGGGVDRCQGGGGTNTLAHCEGQSVPQTSAVNRAPVVHPVTASTDERSVVAIDLLEAATDPDGDSLSITSIDSSSLLGQVRLAKGGVAIYDPSGRLARLAAGATEQTSFGFTVSDGRGLTAQAQATVTVSGIDDAPVAVDDAASAEEDEAAGAIDVLANDTDVDGGPKTIELASQPEHGTVTVDPGRDRRHLPAGPELLRRSRSRPVRLRAQRRISGDGLGDRRLRRRPRRGQATTRPTCREDAPASAIDVLANDTSVDSGPLSIKSVTQPAHGTVAITGGGSGLTYQPAQNFCGEDSFTYGLGGGSGAMVSVTVACVDDPPVAVDDANTVGQDEAASAIDVLANDTDVDGGPKTIESVTQPAHGTVAITGGGSGLTYQPAAGYCNDGEAADEFTYTLNGGASAAVEVTVSCATTVASDPALTPAFDPSVSDYVVHCDGTPLDLSGRAAQGATVSIDGGAATGGSFESSVPLAENQEFGFVVDEGGQQSDYHVRCYRRASRR